MDKEEIKADICDLYTKIMKAQRETKGDGLCNGGNMGPIIASYVMSVYGKHIDTDMLGILNNK